MDSEQTLRRPILRHYIIPRRYVKFNRKTRPPQRKRGSAGENCVPAAETGAQEVLFSAGQDRVLPRRGGCDTILPIWADGFAGITAWCRSADDPRGTTLTQAFYIPGDQEVVLDYKDGLYTPQNPATAFRSCTAACAWRLPTPLPDSILPMCLTTGTRHMPFRRAWSISCSVRRPARTAIS